MRTLLGLPGHIGIEGNEKADELAREGSSNPPVEPENLFAILEFIFSPKLTETSSCDHERWTQKEKARDQGDFVKLKRITGILTGLCLLLSSGRIYYEDATDSERKPLYICLGRPGSVMPS